MIDYEAPDDDPIVAEVRRAREGYAAKFDGDLRLIFEDLKHREEEAARSGQTAIAVPPLTPDDLAKKAG